MKKGKDASRLQRVRLRMSPRLSGTRRDISLLYNHDQPRYPHSKHHAMAKKAQQPVQENISGGEYNSDYEEEPRTSSGRLSKSSTKQQQLGKYHICQIIYLLIYLKEEEVKQTKQRKKDRENKEKLKKQQEKADREREKLRQLKKANGLGGNVHKLAAELEGASITACSILYANISFRGEPRRDKRQ